MAMFVGALAAGLGAVQAGPAGLDLGEYLCGAPRAMSDSGRLKVGEE